MAQLPVASESGTSDFERGVDTGEFRLGQAAGKPAAAARTWALAQVSLLKDEATADPLVFRAAEGILATAEGKTLLGELRNLGTPPRIIVETFLRATELEHRKLVLEDLPESQDDGELHGFTHLFLRQADLEELSPSFPDEVEVFRKVRFRVLVAVPPARLSGTFGELTAFLADSEPVRLLKFAEVLFHELLHIVFGMKAGPENVVNASSGGTLVFRLDKTGHGSDTSFSIDPVALALRASGTIDPKFRQRLVNFVSQLVATGLDKQVGAEIERFKKQAPKK